MVSLFDTCYLSCAYQKSCQARMVGNTILKSRPPPEGRSSRKLAMVLPQVVVVSLNRPVCELPNEYEPRGPTLCVCKRSSRKRRISNPNFIVRLCQILV